MSSDTLHFAIQAQSHPLAYLTGVLTKIVNRHPSRDINQLLPWAYRAQALKAVA
ncbi:transposase domain-containing protein [Bradyrhizobium sp. GM2.2]|uniref:transposase domain-containing protein n=1 Tax=Bradyrhizobium sp. GM2.2 TaxID=3156358 RepID=UPI0033920DA1